MRASSDHGEATIGASRWCAPSASCSIECRIQRSSRRPQRPVLGERRELVVLLVALDDVAVAVDDDVAQDRVEADDDAVLAVVLAVGEAEVLDVRAAADLAHVVPALAVEVVEPTHPLDEEVGPEVPGERVAVAARPRGDDLAVQAGGVGLDELGREVGVVAGRLGRGELDPRGALAAALAHAGRVEEPEADEEHEGPRRGSGR